MSSKRRLARKRCRDKRKYPTVGEAMRFARKIMKSDGDKGKAGAYFCQRCGAYHWGHK